MGFFKWRQKTCGTDGCGHYIPPAVGDPNLCMLCRLSMRTKGKDIKKMSNNLFERCAPFIGLEKEKLYPADDSVCGFTGGYLNGCPVMLWRDHVDRDTFIIEVHAPTETTIEKLFRGAMAGSNVKRTSLGDISGPGLPLFEAKMLAHAWSQEFNPDTSGGNDG